MSAARNLPHATANDEDVIPNVEADDDVDDDAYNATTKVGSGAHVYTEHLLREAAEMDRAHGASRGSPVSQVRAVSTPKPARRSSGPAPAVAPRPPALSPPPPPPMPGTVPVLFAEVEEDDRFDPTALFGRPTSGHTVRLDAALMQAVVAQVDQRAVSGAVRSDAPWTRGPTLPASAFAFRTAADAPYALAAILEPAADAKPRRRTRLLEVLAFVLSFGLVLGLAVYAYCLATM